MHTGPARVTQNHFTRFSSRAFLFSVALCITQVAAAQTAMPISPSVVLVLKLVSSTHVKPATGIVVSDQGLVLVPADFASGEGEMIVLDGGTDIVSNGRPAKLVGQEAAGKLAVLSVEGLSRPGITLSANALDPDNPLHLEAFPPADDIAKGAPPLWLSLEMRPRGADSRISVSSKTPLPAVSGAVIDACGYLAGVSLTVGAQGPDGTGAALVVSGGELKHLLDSTQISPLVANCVPPVQTAEATGAAAVKNKEPVATANTPQPTAPLIEKEDLEPAAPDDSLNGSATQTAGPVSPEPAQQPVALSPELPSIWDSIPFWLPLLGIIVLLVFVWKGLFFYRLSRGTPDRAALAKPETAIQPASDEPVTAPLVTPLEVGGVKPRSVPVFDNNFPLLGERPEGCNGVLLVEGFLDKETSFKRFCFVDTEQVNIVIGRGDADIAIEHTTISRAHVRIESDGDMLSLSDLGSRNGSCIGDIPCLPGEILFIREDDEIFLGDVKLTVRVVRQEAEWA